MTVCRKEVRPKILWRFAVVEEIHKSSCREEKALSLIGIWGAQTVLQKFALRPEGPGAVSVKNERMADATTSDEKLGGSGHGC